MFLTVNFAKNNTLMHDGSRGIFCAKKKSPGGYPPGLCAVNGINNDRIRR
jgi:hypothetical protein